MATVNYTCPSCGAPLTFNPDKQMFCCEYCLSEFSDKYIQDYYSKAESKASEEEVREEKAKQNTKEEQAEEAVVYTCPSCGAEVITTATTAATTCFYCQNPVVLGGRLSGEYLPDRVVPFELSKEKAIDKFMEMCKKKWFLPKFFADKKNFEKMTGVYFPYWYVDKQLQADMTATGKKVSTWRDRNREYTETKIYDVYRSGDIIINNVFERALKGEDRKVLQSVHPYDLSKAKKFAMSYLSGFQAEKRDLEKNDVSDTLNNRVSGYAKTLLEGSMGGYTSVNPKSYHEKTDLESWSYTLLPVWMITYKHNGKIFPYAVNGQTGKTYGKLPVSFGKLALFSLFVAVVAFILCFLGGMLLS